MRTRFPTQLIFIFNLLLLSSCLPQLNFENEKSDSSTNPAAPTADETEDANTTVDEEAKRREKIKLIDLGKEGMKEMIRLQNESGWVFLQEDELTGVKIYGFNLTLPSGSTKEIYRAKYMSPYSPETFFRVIYTNYDDVPLWNPVVTISKKFRKVDGKTALGYQLFQPMGPPAPFPPREIVTVHRVHVTIEDGRPAYTIALRTLDDNFTDPRIPVIEDPELKRGVVYPGAGVSIRRDPKDPDTTLVDFLVAIEMYYELPESARQVARIFEQFQIILNQDLIQNRIRDLLDSQ